MHNDRIKVLYVISSLANEGPTRILLNLVANLDRQQFDPVVATLTAEKKNSLYEQFESLDVPIKRLYGNPRSRWAMLARSALLRRLIKDEKFDIAHAHCPRSLLMLSLVRRRSTKTAYTLHVYPDVQYRAIHGSIKGVIITEISNLALRFIDLPIACSESVALEYLQNRRQAFAFVNNGLEALSGGNVDERKVVLESLGLNPERKYLLYIGRLSPEKRVVELVKTFCSLTSPPVDLIVVGSGSEESNLRNASCHNVHLMGYHSDVQKFFSACDFYISPSATEGLANSLLEALSVGMPCILSDIPSHRSVMNQCGNVALTTFDPSSEENLQEAIDFVLRRDSSEERNAIKKQFSQHYRASVMSSGYEDLYKKALV